MIRAKWFLEWFKLIWRAKKVLSSSLVDDDFKKTYIKILRGKIMNIEKDKLIAICEGYVAQKEELEELRPLGEILTDPDFLTAYTAAVEALPQP